MEIVDKGNLQRIKDQIKRFRIERRTQFEREQEESFVKALKREIVNYGITVTNYAYNLFSFPNNTEHQKKLSEYESSFMEDKVCIQDYFRIADERCKVFIPQELRDIVNNSELTSFQLTPESAEKFYNNLSNLMKKIVVL